MKIAIIDKNKKDIETLTHMLMDYRCPDLDIWIYGFHNDKEFHQAIFKMIDFSIFFINNESVEPMTIFTIKELYPHAGIVITTNNQRHINLNNYQHLFKPYKKHQLHLCFHYWFKCLHISNHLIKVKDHNRLRYLDIHDIYYFESYYGKVFVYTKHHRYQANTKELYKYENALSHQGFISIHKSILVNGAKIKSATLDAYTLIDNRVLYASTRRKFYAYKRYRQYMESRNHLKTRK